jgi:hypothetical protein
MQVGGLYLASTLLAMGKEAQNKVFSSPQTIHPNTSIHGGKSVSCPRHNIHPAWYYSVCWFDDLSLDDVLRTQFYTSECLNYLHTKKENDFITRLSQL